MTKELVELKRGKMFTTSLKFAEEFEIQHSHILEKIRNLIIEYPIVKSQFKEDEFTNIYDMENYDNSLSGNQVQTLMIDQDSLLFVGTFGGGLNF